MEKEPSAQSFASVRFSNGARADSLETTHRFYSFYELNNISLFQKDTLYNWKETVVQLDSLDKGLSVSFFLGNELASRYILKGTWKNNWFYARRRIQAKGVPPLFFFYVEKRSVIGKQGPEICLLQSDMKMGMILFFSGGGADYYHEHYSIR